MACGNCFHQILLEQTGFAVQEVIPGSSWNHKFAVSAQSWRLTFLFSLPSCLIFSALKILLHGCFLSKSHLFYHFPRFPSPVPILLCKNQNTIYHDQLLWLVFGCPLKHVLELLLFLKLSLSLFSPCHLFFQILSDCLRFQFSLHTFPGIWLSFADTIGQVFRNLAPM